MESRIATNSCIVERRSSLGMGHCSRQLRHLPQPHHGSLHRVPGKPSVSYERGVHRGLGHLQRMFERDITRRLWLTITARISLPLHFPMAQDATSVPAGQPRLGIPEVRPISEPPRPPRYHIQVQQEHGRRFGISAGSFGRPDECRFMRIA